MGSKDLSVCPRPLPYMCITRLSACETNTHRAAWRSLMREPSEDTVLAQLGTGQNLGTGA